MTRRLALVITSVVVATLLLAGVGTLVVGNVRAREITRVELRRQAVDVAHDLDALLDDAATRDDPGAVRRRLARLRVLRRALDLQGLAVFTLRRGALVGDEAPAGFDLARLDLDRLGAGEVETGSQGNLVYAAAPAALPSGRVLVVVLTDRANAGTRAAAVAFVVAGLVTLALGIATAVVLGRRLTRPIRDASSATVRIASGELSTRLPEPAPGRHDELTELARSVNAMAVELERSQLLEQQFLLSISHDLRTPLTSIRGYAEAICDGAAEPLRAGEVIRSESRRLERLVADLLDLARLRSRSFSLLRERVDLHALVAVACEAFSPDAAAHGVVIRQVGAPARVLVSADSDRLAQVVANLLENGIKFARSRIDVAVTTVGDAAVLSVDDDGTGFPTDGAAHVFDRLYVAAASPVRAESGSGIGLAIVNELVTAMGGTCSAGRAALGGAQLQVRLPLATHDRVPA